jgi:hypothetical protein
MGQISLQEAHLSRLSNGRANALVPRGRNLPSPDRLIRCVPTAHIQSPYEAATGSPAQAEDVDDTVLLDVIRAIRRRVRA